MYDSTCAERIQADRHKNDVADSKGGQKYFITLKKIIIERLSGKAMLSVPAHPCFRKELNMKILDVDEFNKIVGKSLEECREELTPSFYQGAKIMLDKVNEMAEEDKDE